MTRAIAGKGRGNAGKSDEAGRDADQAQVRAIGRAAKRDEVRGPHLCEPFPQHVFAVSDRRGASRARVCGTLRRSHFLPK